MIFEKFWSSFRAQLNELANFFWEADPIAQMRYEYDRSVAQLKEGREGLETYRGLVERVGRQVQQGQDHLTRLQSQAKAYLKAGERDTAAKFALEAQKAKAQLEQNQEQLKLHETAYDNNLKKIQHANKKLIEVRDKIQRYDADLKMSAAEAEVAKLAQSFQMDLTTDFGQLETMVQEKIDRNRGKTRVAADLSRQGVAEVEAEERMEKVMAEDALRALEIEMGLVSPETSAVGQAHKELGPAVAKQTN